MAPKKSTAAKAPITFELGVSSPAPPGLSSPLESMPTPNSTAQRSPFELGISSPAPPGLPTPPGLEGFGSPPGLPPSPGVATWGSCALTQPGQPQLPAFPGAATWGSPGIPGFPAFGDGIKDAFDFYTPVGTPALRNMGMDPYLDLMDDSPEPRKPGSLTASPQPRKGSLAGSLTASPQPRKGSLAGSLTASPQPRKGSLGYPTTPDTRHQNLGSLMASPNARSYPTTPHDYSFTLRKADGVPLGLELTPTKTKSLRGLRIDGIHPGGAIEAWNKQCAPPSEEGPTSRAILPGDVLVQVNASYGDKDEMLSECKSKQLLWLALVRGDETLSEVRRFSEGVPSNTLHSAPERVRAMSDASGCWKSAGFKSPKPRPSRVFGTPRASPEPASFGTPSMVQSPKLGG